ncbi:MAG TPA: 2-phospho-L-lactate guanylyltransferase [Aggregatilineales bacterium]|nr:2-phospho-L-lactate guanylyltransferase [Anaerolineae bacterium]HUN09858.1 2-phospho-L-lactate guanylyltransferase [Aggregatilineales bacterium]
MSVWAIIPVKPLNRSKTRLAPVLSPAERQKLAESMFRHVLETVRMTHNILGTLVISRDSRALAIARDYGARTVQESGAPELNGALTRATQVLVRWHVRAILVLPADLPLIAPDDLASIVRMGDADRSVVLATDQQGDGTNAMFMRPPGLIPYAYGIGSFERHYQMAVEAGADVQVYRSDRMMLDVDLPSDLETYNAMVHS